MTDPLFRMLARLPQAEPRRDRRAMPRLHGSGSAVRPDRNEHPCGNPSWPALAACI